MRLMILLIRVIFLRKLLLIDRKVSRLGDTFTNNSLDNIKQLKAQLSKLILLGGFIALLMASPSARNVSASLGKEFVKNEDHSKSDKGI